MTDREKVIKGLESVASDMQEEVDEWRDYSDSELAHGLTCDCDWWINTLQKVRDALALLKAQEPRVMTPDEACNSDCVWYDWRTRGVRPAKITRSPYKNGVYRVQRIGDIDEWVHADEYNEYWRCWTSRPTDEQRKAVKWDV